MFTISITPKANQAAGNAYDWYQEQQNGLGEIFLNELDIALDKLENDPFLYAVVKRQYRQLLLRKFPYVLIYEIFDNQIVVINIFHTSRNPKKKFLNK